MPLAHAYNLMVQEQVRRLPVVEGERLVGAITRGIAAALAPRLVPMMGGADPDIAACSLQVRQVMTRRSQAVTEDMSMADAVRLMLDQHPPACPWWYSRIRRWACSRRATCSACSLAREAEGGAPERGLAPSGASGRRPLRRTPMSRAGCVGSPAGPALGRAGER